MDPSHPMELKLAKQDELPAIRQIISEAQELLASLGIDQWQDGYPQASVIQEDIDKEECYVALDGGDIIGTTMFTLRGEPTYNTIEGAWITADNARYGVIHRMAVGKASRGKGVARYMLKACENTLISQGISSMRIDTHEDNKGMQQLLRSSGYRYCGIIYLESGSKRLAYEKVF